MFPETDPTCLDDIDPDLYYTPFQVASLPEWPYHPRYVYQHQLFKDKWYSYGGSAMKTIKGDILRSIMIKILFSDISEISKYSEIANHSDLK